MINPNSININRAILFCNIYNLFFAAAKASLFPFLTLFYRYLGLSAIQVGYLMAAKMLSAFLWASVWAQQAIKLRRRRFYLFLSLTMMLATNLSVWFVSASIDDTLQAKCNALAPKSTPGTTLNTMKVYPNFTSTLVPNNGTNHTAVYTSNSTVLNHSITATPTKSNNTVTTNISFISNAVTAPVVTKYPPTKITLHPTSVATGNTKSISSNHTQTKQEKNIKRRHKKSIITANATTQTPQLSISSFFSNSSWNFNNLWLKFKAWMIGVITKENTRVFLVIFLIILIGEPIGSAAEKLADDSWYDLLDCIDRLEKYGKHRMWTSISFFLVPTMVGFLVERTQCLLPFHMNHILIHCFSFTIFLGFSLLLTLVLPMPLNTKLVSTSRVKKGVEITCFGCNGFVYMTTVFFMGAAYSTVSNFLFWLIEDIGGHEGVMGLCIMVGTFSEFPILLYGEYFVKHMGTRAMITLSIFLFSVRVFVYTFIFSSWFILPLEILHAFTHTALWYAVFSNPVFNVSPEIDRSIRNILSSAYFGIGFSIGSLVSGYIVDYWNLTMLFRSVAVFCFVWSFIFFFLDKYMPRQAPVKYQRLLQAEEEENSDDSTAAVESDWLEQALKESWW